MEKLVLFVCVEDACRVKLLKRSSINWPKGRWAISAGTKPAESIDPKAIGVMEEVGIDINGQKPRLLTKDVIEKASKVVSMGCGDDICPATFGKTEN